MTPQWRSGLGRDTEEDDGHPAVAGVSEHLTVMTTVIRTKEEEGTAFFS